MKLSRVLFLALMAPLVLFGSLTYAQQMQSSSYRIQFDSVNGGGVLSTSSSYRLEDTVGEVATGNSGSPNYSLNAGYQQPDSYIAISAPADLALPAITGLGGEQTSGTVAWNVTTDNIAGYSLYIQSSTSPALESTGGASFSDYPISAAPDFSFNVPAASSTFAFSPEGSDIVQRYKDNGLVCNTGTSDASDRCYDGLSTSSNLIGQATSPNSSSGGATTTVRFKAGVGSSKIQDSGTYSATVTVTAVAL